MRPDCHDYASDVLPDVFTPVYLFISLFSLRGGAVGGVVAVRKLYPSPLLKTKQRSKEIKIKTKTAATCSGDMWSKEKKKEKSRV